MELHVESKEKREIVDITDMICSAASIFSDGILQLNARHTTVGLFLTELDDELGRDYLKIADTLLANGRPYEHVRKNNPNTEAHALSAIFGTAITVQLTNGKIDLGPYQRIVLFELDGPKAREVSVRFVKS